MPGSPRLVEELTQGFLRGLAALREPSARRFEFHGRHGPVCDFLLDAGKCGVDPAVTAVAMFDAEIIADDSLPAGMVDLRTKDGEIVQRFKAARDGGWIVFDGELGAEALVGR